MYPSPALGLYPIVSLGLGLGTHPTHIFTEFLGFSVYPVWFIIIMYIRVSDTWIKNTVRHGEDKKLRHSP